jgi:hypothetical protein
LHGLSVKFTDGSATDVLRKIRLSAGMSFGKISLATAIAETHLLEGTP